MSEQLFPAHRSIRCILFDFGDTLWKANPEVWNRLDNEVARRTVSILHEFLRSHDVQLAEADAEFGRRFQNQLQIEIRKRIGRDPYLEPDFTDATLQTLEQLGLPRLTSTAGATLFESLRVRIPGSRVLFPDTHATLRALQHKGYILGVVTNRAYGGALFQEDIQQLGFYEYFDPSAMAISVDLGIRKPNPDIFLYALDKLGVAPEHAAMVGDSLHADILGANQLGILSIWFPKHNLQDAARTSLLASQPEQTTLSHEAVLTYAKKNPRWEHKPPIDDTQPDLTIYHLSELLNIF